jgi:hypothetical protein
MTKNKMEMPWLGKFFHENTILVPNKNNKTIAFTIEDWNPITLNYTCLCQIIRLFF